MDTSQRIINAKKSLLGVSIGDAFGESFFGESDRMTECIGTRKIPDTKWEFTDDTVMSIAVFEELEKSGGINQDALVRKFTFNHQLDTNRGYGATARKILREIHEGLHWKEVAGNVFDGQGSMGNGAAMRVCPIGAYHYDNSDQVKDLAIKSTEVTHSNIEAIAGAIAIATATALATRMRMENVWQAPLEFIDMVVKDLPTSDTKSKIQKSKAVPYHYHNDTVKSILGNGTQMTSQDTVPFAIWCSAYNLSNFEEALWKAVSILGDRDTICAMVGGITIMSCDEKSVPDEWKNSVEDFETSIFRTKGNN